jgi:hypothetical protein
MHKILIIPNVADRPTIYADVRNRKIWQKVEEIHFFKEILNINQKDNSK